MLWQLGRALRLAVLLLGAKASAGVGTAAADAPPRPRLSVLYIIVDDLRPELGYSQPQRKGLSTPNVDALANKSMIFDRAFIQQGVCGPTRNSFMSGRRPAATRAWNFKSSFRDAPGGASWTALPQAFKQAGYLTAGFGKTYHPGQPKAYDCPAFPADCPSWSVQYQPGAGKGGHGCHNVSEQGETGCASGAWQACNDPDDEIIDGNVTNLALAQMRKAQASSTPFFINVGIHKPHVPWVFPRRFLDAQLSTAETDLPLQRVQPTGMPPIAYYKCENLCNDSVVGHGCFNRSTPFAADYTREYRRAYRAATSWMDFLVGRLTAELATLGLDSRTIIAFNGDQCVRPCYPTDHALTLTLRAPVVGLVAGISARKEAGASRAISRGLPGSRFCCTCLACRPGSGRRRWLRWWI